MSTGWNILPGTRSDSELFPVLLHFVEGWVAVKSVDLVEDSGGLLPCHGCSLEDVSADCCLGEIVYELDLGIAFCALSWSSGTRVVMMVSTGMVSAMAFSLESPNSLKPLNTPSGSGSITRYRSYCRIVALARRLRLTILPFRILGEGHIQKNVGK